MPNGIESRIATALDNQSPPEATLGLMQDFLDEEHLEACTHLYRAFSRKHATAYIDQRISVQIRNFLIARRAVDLVSFEAWAAANPGWQDRLTGASLRSPMFPAALDDLAREIVETDT